MVLQVMRSNFRCDTELHPPTRSHMAALESTSVQPMLEIPSDLDIPGAEEGAVSSLSVEDSRW